VDEAVSNAVEHAYSTPGAGCGNRHRGVELHVIETAAPEDARPDCYRIAATVTDRGRWRPRPARPGFRGRGLQIMHAVTDSVEVTATGTGTRVRMLSRAVRAGGRRAGDAARRWGDGMVLLMLTSWLPRLSWAA
jgi:anti-sigma regulatory factor (Ser/Thr protein kinase)